MAARNAFIDLLMPAALQASQMTGIDPRIIVAQAAQETGWGQHAPGNNYFGIKSHGKPGGNTLSTTEYVNGRPVTQQASFRGYSSPAESVMGYADFINSNPRYKPFKAAEGLDAQLKALGASGYATDPNYAQSVGAIARSIPLDGSAPSAPQTSPASAPAAMPSPFTPSPASPSPVPVEVAQYAAADDSKPSPLQGLLKGLEQAFEPPPAPRPGRFPGGPSSEQANGLLKAALAGPTLANLLMSKRV